MREKPRVAKPLEMPLPADLLDAIRDRAGLTAADHVLLGVRRAMAGANSTDPARYRRLLDSEPGAFSSLITELTVGETYFLRESGQFDFLIREVLPELGRRAGADRLLRAWSAGCATGEEAYSLAIAVHESLTSARISVLGTDIAESRLATARAGLYGQWSLRGVPAEIVSRYFTREDTRARVASSLRSDVEFRCLNLASPDWSSAGVMPGSMDLIFCRNVLIYLDEATTARIARGLLESLSPDGWLFLGASDPALMDLVSCEVIITGAGIAYRHKGAAAPRAVRAAAAVRREPARARWSDHDSGDSQSREISIAPSWIANTTGVQDRTEGTKNITDTAALLARASIAYVAGEYALAADTARQVVADGTTQPAVWIILVRSLANLGRHEEAGLACAAGLDINRTSAELTYLHAILLRESGNNTEALNALRCAVYLDRLFVVGHLAMGEVLSALGDRDGARRSFRNAERMLAGTPDSQTVSGADGIDAGRLRSRAQLQLSMIPADPVR